MRRRNWLFAGSDAGSERAAIILTVIETAERAGLEVQTYLRDLLVKLSSGWLQSRLDELLPENCTPGEAVTAANEPASHDAAPAAPVTPA